VDDVAAEGAGLALGVTVRAARIGRGIGDGVVAARRVTSHGANGDAESETGTPGRDVAHASRSSETTT